VQLSPAVVQAPAKLANYRKWGRTPDAAISGRRRYGFGKKDFKKLTKAVLLNEIMDYVINLII
jgi:hypothetical protein